MLCREACGACCIAPSISSAIPGMPEGKPAGIPCIHLTARRQCGIFDSPLRPAVCSQLQPQQEMCGNSAQAALDYLWQLELATQPAKNHVGE